MAGRPRTPTNILALKGAYKNHPERLKEREGEVQNVNPVGPAPDELSDEEKVCWNTFVKESIPGVLGEADRVAIAEASMLLAKCKNREATIPERNLLFKFLSQFGMLPADRSKISVPQAKPKNEFDGF